MGWGGASSPGGGADSSPDAPGGGLGSGAFGGDGPSISGQSKSSQDTSTIEGFRAAIAKAMGATIENNVDREAFDAEMEDAANNRAIAAAVEARDKAARETKEQQERQAMMDQIDAMQNKTNFADPTKAPSQNINDVNPNDLGVNQGNIGVDVDDRGLLGAAIDDPQGTQEGLDAEQEARDAIGRSQRSAQEQAMNEAVAIGAQRNISRQDQEEAIDKAYYDDRTIDRQKRENMKAIQDRFGFSPGNPHMEKNLDYEARESLASHPAMRDPVFRDLAFDLVDIDRRTAPANSTVETIMGYVMKALNPALGFGTVMKGILEALGFNTNLNMGQRAITAAITAFEGGIPGQKGAGGLMEGERGDSFGDEQAMKALEKVAPWTKGLNQRQIEYYFADGNEEELEWVTNLYNQMNPE